MGEKLDKDPEIPRTKSKDENKRLTALKPWNSSPSLRTNCLVI